jgi:hypothetical protein
MKTRCVVLSSHFMVAAAAAAECRSRSWSSTRMRQGSNSPIVRFSASTFTVRASTEPHHGAAKRTGADAAGGVRRVLLR